MRSALAAALRTEAGGWRSLARWVTRRPDVPAGGTAFPYRSAQVAPILVFTAVSVIEVVGLDLLLRPWPAARAVLLVLGVWGVLFCLGMLAAITVHPHVVDPEGVRVRSGATVDLHLPWESIASARRVRRGHEARAVSRDTIAVNVAVSHDTTVEITLAHPLRLRVHGEDAEATVVRLHADDAAGLVTAVRRRIEVASGR